jgi:hypothetical protein
VKISTAMLRWFGPCLHSWSLTPRIACFAGLVSAPALLAAAEPLEFQVQTDVAHRELSSGFCWFHPRVAALRGYGKEGRPAVIMTIQKHLAASDHYSGLCFLRTDDLGKTWSGPTEIPELVWRKEPNGETISVADVTPGWHPPSRKMLAIGTKVRYSPAGVQLLDRPRSRLRGGRRPPARATQAASPTGRRTP